MANEGTDAVRESARPRTTIQVYEEDANWLRARQRQVSFQRNEHVPMFDLVHEFIGTMIETERGS